MFEVGIPVPIGIKNASVRLARPAISPAIMPEQVELVIDNPPDTGIDIAQVSEAHLV